MRKELKVGDHVGCGPVDRTVGVIVAIVKPKPKAHASFSPVEEIYVDWGVQLDLGDDDA